MTNKTYAVLTGDLVKSRRLQSGDLERARRAVLEALEQLPQAGVEGKAEFFRGDSWQALLSRPEQSLRAAIYVRAALRGLDLPEARADSRVAIGIGPVGRIEPSRISLSTGEAFQRSGKALDELGATSRLAIAFPEGSVPVGPWVEVALGLVDRLVRGWKPRQAQAILVLLAKPGASHAEVAEQLDPPVTRQAVTKALAGAGWDAVEAAIALFEQKMGQPK